MTGERITFPSNGGTAHGYLELPPSGSGPGLVVIQEWWGLTDHIEDVTRRFAGEGFVAMAPDLYGGKTAHDGDEAGRMMQELPVDQAARDLQGATDYLIGHDAVVGDKVGTVGFCMGGGFVLALAAVAKEKVGAAVPFYGIVQDGFPDLAEITAPVLGHFGDEDQMNPLDQVSSLEQQLRDAGVDVTFHTYPAGHAFFNDENLLGTYKPDQAALAWDRTVTFLRERLAA